MRCHEAEGLLAPEFSESLDAATQRELALHLESCAACRSRLQQEYELDRVVTAAVSAATPSDASLVARLHQALPHTRVRASRWQAWRWPALAFAATLLLAAGLALTRFSSRDPMHLLCQDAADDHRSEVVLREPRPWHTGSEIATLAARVVPHAAIPQSVAGLPLEKARICGLLQARALHLVYGRGAREVSVFLMLQSDLPSASLPPSAAVARLHQEEDYGVSVTTFAGTGLGVAVVGDSQLSRDVADELARAL
jgi:hypothetical protein